MKRLLARLEVFVDVDSTDKSSGIRSDDGRNFELVLYPQQRDYPMKDMHDFQTVFAHELGHFIAHATHDPTHRPKQLIQDTLTGQVCDLNIPAERRAWEFAKQMSPDLNQETMAHAISSYEKAEAHLNPGFFTRLKRKFGGGK